jgi:hypothetical protein
MPTPSGPPSPTSEQPAGRGQRKRRDRYGRRMSKWSTATGRIRRHATGILGGRIGGVGEAPSVPASVSPAVPAVAAMSAAGSTADSTATPTTMSAVGSVAEARHGTPPATGLQPDGGGRLSDDTVRMPRQPAATDRTDAVVSPDDTNGAAVPSAALTERTVNLRLPPALRRAARRPGNRVGQILRAIDRRLLPPVGRGLARLGRGALWGRVVATTAAVACVALTVVAVYTATRPATVTPELAGIHVGVSTGTDIPQYISTTVTGLDRAIAAARPGDPTVRYALVSFARYKEPAQLGPLLVNVEAVEVFLRARPAGVFVAQVHLIPGDVVKAMSAHASELSGDADDLQTQVQRLGQTPNEITLKKTYADFVAADNAEMSAYVGNCACAFGAVVHGSLSTLKALAGEDGVRAVDLVPLRPDVSRDTFMPPVPEQRGIATLPPVEETGHTDR